jgi:AcrR family transcriptional regulator
VSVRKTRPRAKSRRRLTKDARREQILEAALAAFHRGGYHGTHVDDVIEEAGVARGTFYLHFESKHEVFAALVERMLGFFLAARPPVENTDLRSARDAKEMLMESGRAVLSTFQAHRRLGRLLFEEAVGIDKGFQERLEAHMDAWRRRLRETGDLFRRRGLARKDLDTELAAEAILGMYERVTRTYLFRGPPADLERLLEALVSYEMRILGVG